MKNSANFGQSSSFVKDLVSIHFITYNQEKYVARALESVLAQTYKNWELIISDDFSKDGTIKIIESYIPYFKGKAVFNQNNKNLGITLNCQKALSLCKGQYICFLTGDDYFHPEKIEEQVKFLKKNSNTSLVGHECKILGEKILYSDFISIPRKSFRWFFLNFNNKGIKSWLRKGCLFSAISIMVNRKLNVEVKFDSRIKYCCDYKFFLDFLLPNYKFGFIYKELATYFKTEKSVTYNQEGILSDFIKTYDLLENDPAYKYFLEDIHFGKKYHLFYGRLISDFSRTKSFKTLFNSFCKNSFFYLKSPKMISVIILLLLSECFNRVYKFFNR